MTVSLAALLGRGDEVAIERGHLVIRPVSGSPVPDWWLSEHRDRLTAEVLKSAGKDAYRYIGYTTGKYGNKSGFDGVTLQFVSVLTGESLYAIFNANLKRQRGPKAGSALPKGRFTVGKRSEFLKFWESTDLTYNRLSDFHDYMGKLKDLLFTGDAEDGRIRATTLRAANVVPKKMAEKRPTSPRQVPDKSPTTSRQDSPTRNQSKAKSPCGLQPFSTTGLSNHGKAVIRERGYTEAPTPLDTPNTGYNQSDYQQMVDLGWGPLLTPAGQTPKQTPP